jgi:hypothetical protein
MAAATSSSVGPPSCILRISFSTRSSVATVSAVRVKVAVTIEPRSALRSKVDDAP